MAKLALLQTQFITKLASLEGFVYDRTISIVFGGLHQVGIKTLALSSLVVYFVKQDEAEDR